MKASISKRTDGGYGNRLILLEAENEKEQSVLIDFKEQLHEKQYWKWVGGTGIGITIDIDWFDK
jgi:hypothetical protein